MKIEKTKNPSERIFIKKILSRLTKFNPKVLKSSNQFGKFIRI
jgi:hypothetical protein